MWPMVRIVMLSGVPQGRSETSRAICPRFFVPHRNKFQAGLRMTLIVDVTSSSANQKDQETANYLFACSRAFAE